jgi:ribosomal protein L16 Arg81 hydroxylase
MTILEELIQPLSLPQFAAEYLYKQPYAAPLKAARFKDLISWELLDQIFSSGHRNCWLPQMGHLPSTPELQSGQLTSAQAREGFRQGRTVLVRKAERVHPALSPIARDFFNLLRGPVDIQLYGTPAGQQGFDWHYDVEDVFVIQSVGEKEFFLRENTITQRPLAKTLPKDLQYEKEVSQQRLRCLLKAGDWLYIPAGYWHKAHAITDSFHLSIGVLSSSR